jgi:hypothetical protein
MGTLTRKYDFVPGQKAYSNQIDEELNQLVDGHNNQETSLTNLTNRITTAENNISTNGTVISSLQTGKANATDVFTKAELQSTTDNVSGANKIGATKIASSPTDVQGILEWLNDKINTTSLGQIPDGSITVAKLSFDPVTQLELDMHTTDGIIHITNNDRINWNAKANFSDTLNFRRKIRMGGIY